MYMTWSSTNPHCGGLLQYSFVIVCSHWVDDVFTYLGFIIRLVLHSTFDIVLFSRSWRGPLFSSFMFFEMVFFLCVFVLCVLSNVECVSGLSLHVFPYLYFKQHCISSDIEIVVISLQNSRFCDHVDYIYLS